MLLLLFACAVPDGAGQQSPIDLHLVVHVDPLPRHGDLGCDDDRLRSCGGLSAAPWRERVDNLAWLSDRWTQTGRTLDLQWGPEMALSLAEDEQHLASLRDSLVQGGDPDPDGTLAEGLAVGQAAVQQLLDHDAAAFAAHVHTVAPDPSGTWGSAPLATGEGPHPCDAYDGDPLAEAPLATTEAVVFYGAQGAAAVAERFGAEVRSFTGAIPRVLADKTLVLTDPDAIDPDVDRDWPAAFHPWLAGSGYSECMIRAGGTPPFELYHAAAQRSLGGGDGPLVHPGEPVVGNMADHLDMPADGAAGAAARRILTGMLNWRMASLQGQPDRPWAYSFHTHLFHLDEGTVAVMDPDARQLSAVDGQPFRQDLEAVASFVDRFAGGGSWQGVGASDGGGPLRWGLPGDQEALDADFVFGDPDAAPPDSVDGDYPYLPLLATELSNTHLVCTGQLDGTDVFGLLRCAQGWSWGGSAPGFHCADDAEPSWRFVVVPAGPRCLAGVDAVQAASVTDDTLGEPTWCSGGLWVSTEGMLVVPPDGSGRLVAACDAPLDAGG